MHLVQTNQLIRVITESKLYLKGKDLIPVEILTYPLTKDTTVEEIKALLALSEKDFIDLVYSTLPKDYYVIIPT